MNSRNNFRSLFWVLVALIAPLPAVVAQSSGWNVTASMSTARSNHTATLLPNGKVLVTGGVAGYVGHPSMISSAEVYDPATATWSTTGSMSTARQGHTAILLQNGKVLVIGGSGDSGSLASAELYDPTSLTWSTTGSMSMGHVWIT